MNRSRPAFLLGLALVLFVAGVTISWLSPKPERFDIVVVVDVSFSMAADDDIEESRIATARAIITDQFLPLIDEGSRVGLVTFCGGSYEVMPLSSRRQVAERFVNDIEIGFAPGNGSCFAPGLNRACEILQRQGRKDVLRRIVLMTHGESSDMEEELEEAVQSCRASGAGVTILGVGSPEERAIPICRLPKDAREIFPKHPFVSRYENSTARQFDSPTKIMTVREDGFLQALAGRVKGRCVLINSRSDFEKVTQ